MIRLSSPRDQARVMDAIAQAGRPGGQSYDARIGFLIGGVDFTDEFTVAEWGQTEIPITLDADLSCGSVPTRLESADTSLLIEIEGVLIPGIYGQKTLCRPGENAYQTNLISSSAGALLNSDDAIKMGSYTEYPEWQPHRVVWDVARRLPYDQNLVDIQTIPDTLVDFSPFGTEPGFLAEEKTGDVLARLSAYNGVGYQYRDTAFNGFAAWNIEPLDRKNTTTKTYHAKALPDWNLSRPVSPEVLYSDVRVFCTNAQGKIAWEVREEVPYTGERRRPHQNRTLDIPFNDTSPNADRNGRAHAAKMALLLSRMNGSGEMLLPAFDPLYERGDTYRVEEDVKNKDGHTEILWGMRTESYKHGYGADLSSAGGSGDQGLMATQILYSATIIEENKVRPPALIVPNTSTGVVKQLVAPWGAEAGGEEIYFLDSVEWAAAENDDLIFYDGGSANVNPDDSDEIVVNSL